VSSILSYIEKEVGGEAVKFAKLSPRDRAAILQKILDERRVKFLASLEKQGVTGEAYINEVDAYDQQHRTIDDLVRYINGPIGQAHIIEFAFKKANRNEPVDKLDGLVLDNDEASTFAFELACIKVVFIKPGNSHPAGNTQQAPSEETQEQRPSVPASSSH
jgi:hypothetical protein